MNWHRFRNVRENDEGSGYGSSDGSVEITAEIRRGPGNDRGVSTSKRMSGGRPMNKKMRVDQGGASGSTNNRGWSGNGLGTEERSRRSVPLNIQRSQERQPTLRMRMENNRRTVEQRERSFSQERPRPRNWSPIRSPEDLDRSRPRDRDLREEMNLRRGAGNSLNNNRGRSLNRGRGPRRNSSQSRGWDSDQDRF